MESTSRLQSSSIKEGTLRLLDSAGNSIVVLGKQDDGASHGISVWNANGRSLMWVTSEQGQRAPVSYAAATPNGSASVAGSLRPGTSSASFFELWRADLYSIGSLVNYDITAFANGGNMDWRILAYEYYAGTPIVVASGNETTNVQRTGAITIPSTCLNPGTGSDPAGRNLTLRVEAKKNSGASTVDIAMSAQFANYN
jgi:hypothetical protein